MCDGTRDCTDVKVGQAQADQKVVQKMHLFREKKCVDRMTFAVCMTGRRYRTFAFILLKNNF